MRVPGLPRDRANPIDKEPITYIIPMRKLGWIVRPGKEARTAGPREIPVVDQCAEVDPYFKRSQR